QAAGTSRCVWCRDRLVGEHSCVECDRGDCSKDESRETKENAQTADVVFAAPTCEGDSCAKTSCRQSHPEAQTTESLPHVSVREMDDRPAQRVARKAEGHQADSHALGTVIPTRDQRHKSERQS